MPDWEPVLVKRDAAGVIATALNNADGITMCVRGGIVLDIKSEDLPPDDRLSGFHISLAKRGVYVDNPNHDQIYNLAGANITHGTWDLDVIIVNPAMWDAVPEQDAGSLRDKKILKMPRYMNHRVDRVAERVVPASELARYGVLGHEASVLNYVGVLTHGLYGAARYAYALDRVSPFINNLSEEKKAQAEAYIGRCATQSKFIKSLAESN
jgi:hypothetical protein